MTTIAVPDPLSSYITTIQQSQDDKELHWLIAQIISPEFPQIIETLEICRNLLMYNSPQQPDPKNRIERGPAIKLPVSSGKSEVLKGIVIRDGENISQFQVSIHEPHLNKYIHKLNLVKPVLLPQIITAKESIEDSIDIINQLLDLFKSEIHEDDERLVRLFINLLEKIQISKTSLQIPIDPNLVFPLNITPPDSFEPELVPSIAIDFYISQAEMCIDLKSLHRVKEKPWGEIEKSTGRSYIDKIRDEMKLPNSQSSIISRTPSIQTYAGSFSSQQVPPKPDPPVETSTHIPPSPPLNVTDIEKRLHEMTAAASATEHTENTSGFNLGKVMSRLQLGPKHDPIDYITKCITYNSMVVMVSKKVEVSSPDPVLVSAFTKLDSVEYLISSYLDCLNKLMN